MRVLSLFDGIACGRVALERVGIHVSKYFASEIDENAIKIAKKNFPSIQHIGDVTKITEKLIYQISSGGGIDLVIGGSPCQSLSSVNSRLTKEEYGVNGTGESRLFWEYVRVLNLVKKYNPNVKFLLENVGSANAEDKRIISEELGCEGRAFNSMLLSAQNRNRVYWTNIPFTLPTERKEIYMQDILEDSVADKYYLTERMSEWIRVPAKDGWKSGNMDIDLPIARPLNTTIQKMHRASQDNYVTTEYHPVGRSNVRRLTPLECERLQTLDDNYTEGLKDNDRYKCIGNGWTVDVIAWIFQGLKTEENNGIQNT